MARVIDALGVHEILEAHEADGADSEHHDELGDFVKAILVIFGLALVLLDVLKELN